jgi:hypothetical protein
VPGPRPRRMCSRQGYQRWGFTNIYSRKCALTQVRHISGAFPLKLSPFSFALFSQSGALKIAILQMFVSAHIPQFGLVLSAKDGATWGVPTEQTDLPSSSLELFD